MDLHEYAYSTEPIHIDPPHGHLASGSSGNVGCSLFGTKSASRLPKGQGVEFINRHLGSGKVQRSPLRVGGEVVWLGP